MWAHIKLSAKNIGTQTLDALLPPRCVVTGEPVERQGMVDPKAWASLDFITSPYCDLCGFPFEFEVDSGSLCTSCLSHTPPFEKARSALKYNETSRDLVLSFKHADKTHIVTAFVPWLMRAGAAFLSEADVLIPIPLHYRRLVSRRYNQAGLIAEALAKGGGMPVLYDVLRRHRSTPSQGHLKAAERHKNVRRAFTVSPDNRDKISSKKIVLIDDVYTTGATVKECTKTLLSAGASSVFVLTLVRVARPGMD